MARTRPPRWPSTCAAERGPTTSSMPWAFPRPLPGRAVIVGADGRAHALGRPPRRAASRDPGHPGRSGLAGMRPRRGGRAEGPVSEMAGSSTCLNAAVQQPLSVLDVTHYPHVVPGRTPPRPGSTPPARPWPGSPTCSMRHAGGGPAHGLRPPRREVAASPPGADGVLALPVLGDGERTDPDLRAAFTGLSLRHDRAVLARAMEVWRSPSATSSPPDQGRRSVTELGLRRRRAPRLVEPHQGRRHRRAGGHGTGRRGGGRRGDAGRAGCRTYATVDEAIATCVRPSSALEPDPATAPSTTSASRLARAGRGGVARRETD